MCEIINLLLPPVDSLLSVPGAIPVKLSTVTQHNEKSPITHGVTT